MGVRANEEAPASGGGLFVVPLSRHDSETRRPLLRREWTRMPRSPADS
jgi:hypothetical protein